MSLVFDSFYWWRQEFGSLSTNELPDDDTSEMPREVPSDGGQFNLADQRSSTAAFPTQPDLGPQLADAPLTYSAWNLFPSMYWDWMNMDPTGNFQSLEYPSTSTGQLSADAI
jgi:hypothetical protein